MQLRALLLMLLARHALLSIASCWRCRLPKQFGLYLIALQEQALQEGCMHSPTATDLAVGCLLCCRVAGEQQQLCVTQGSVQTHEQGM